MIASLIECKPGDAVLDRGHSLAVSTTLTESSAGDRVSFQVELLNKNCGGSKRLPGGRRDRSYLYIAPGGNIIYFSPTLSALI